MPADSNGKHASAAMAAAGAKARWSIDKVVALYRDAYAAHGNSPAAVQWPKGRQELRFEALTRQIAPGAFSVLDYGCGLAHLKDYLDARFAGYSYHGVDVVPEFIRDNALRHPGARFSVVRGHQDIRDAYDHIVISGTFNVAYADDAAQHRATVREALEHLFQHARKSLAVNFMTDKVDFRQEHAYHEDPLALCQFVGERLSRRLTLNQSYMPYEFTVTAFKVTEILRPDNVYRPA